MTDFRPWPPGPCYLSSLFHTPPCTRSPLAQLCLVGKWGQCVAQDLNGRAQMWVGPSQLLWSRRASCRPQWVGSDFVDLSARPWFLSVDQFSGKNTGHQETRARPWSRCGQ